MEMALHLLERYGLLVVFLNLLLSEGGLPIPAYPTLMTAAVGMAAGGYGAPELLATAVSASLLADTLWFWHGRRHGRRVLGALCRLSFSPDSCVRQTETLFSRLGVWSLLFAKFFPGLGKLAIALAGMTRTPPALFILLDVVGATFYVGVPIGLGWLFRNAIADILAAIARFGLIGLFAVLAALVLYIGMKWFQRWLFIRRLRMDRITVDELVELIDGGAEPIILDVRPAALRIEAGIIPGALPAHPADPGSGLERHPRDHEVVVYCSCPNEASAAIAARHLKRLGFTRIRPLLGGIDAWVKSGRPLQVERLMLAGQISGQLQDAQPIGADGAGSGNGRDGSAQRLR